MRAMVRAIMRDSQEERDVCLIDISTRGLLATTARPPRNGEIVELRIGRNALVGQVRWSSERRFGIVLRDRVSVMALVDGGKANASLARSAGARPASGSVISGISASPAITSRIVQMCVFAVIAALAAYLIMGISEGQFSPVKEAMHDANADEVVTPR